MAQILKYNSGGSPGKTYGTFTIDNTTYEVDDDFIKQLSNYGKSLSPEIGGQFQHIIDALKNGKDLKFDSPSATLYGDVDFDLTDRQKRRVTHGRTAVGKTFGAINRGKEERARNATFALRDFVYNKPKPTGTKYDWSKERTAEYQVDDKGEYVLNDAGNKILVSSPGTLSVFNWLDHLADISGYKDYDTFEGVKGVGKDLYIDFYNRLGPQGIDDLRKRIEEGSWTENDRQMLDDFKVFLDSKKRQQAQTNPEQTTSSDQQEDTGAKERAGYTNAGWNYNNNSIFQLGPDGIVTIVDPELLRIIGNNNVWLNNDFRDRYTAYASYIPENTGLFVINGRVYRGLEDQADLQKIQSYLDWVNENKATAGNSPIIKQFWNTENSGWYNLGRDSEGRPIYSPVFNGRMYGRDVSGNYRRSDSDPLIYEYFPEYDVDNSDLFDTFGIPLASQAVKVFIDPISREIVTPEGARYQYLQNLALETDRQRREAYTQNENKPTAFREMYNINNQPYIREAWVGGNQNAGYGYYWQPDTGNYYWFDTTKDRGNATISDSMNNDQDEFGQYIWNIDPELGEYLRSHPEVLNDPEVAERIFRLIRSPYLAAVTFRDTNVGDYDKYPELQELLTRLYKGMRVGRGNQRYSRDGINLRGIQTSQELANRGLAFMHSGIQPYKNGGIIKFQGGGENSIKSSKPAVHTINTPQREMGKEKVIGDGTDLTSADWAEIAALGADGVSLIASFVPVYGNIVGGVAGALGSFTNFGSDVARDGLDWGDAGNLVANLGLDLATLIPGAGTYAHAGKLAKMLSKSKAVAKAAKLAIGASNAYGLGNAFATAYNNLQDGTWTISDLRTIVNGLRAATNIAKTKGSATKRGGQSNVVTLTSRNTDLPTIKLTKSELEAIDKLPSNQRIDKLEELISGKLGSARTDVSDILSEYGINKGSDWSWRKPFSLTSTVKTSQFEYDRLPDSYRDPRRMRWYDWNRRATIRDAKANELNPYYVREKTTPVIMSNIVRWPSDNSESSPVMLYDINNPPSFYKNGGKVIKAGNGFGNLPQTKKILGIPSLTVPSFNYKFSNFMYIDHDAEQAQLGNAPGAQAPAGGQAQTENTPGATTGSNPAQANEQAQSPDNTTVTKKGLDVDGPSAEDLLANTRLTSTKGLDPHNLKLTIKTNIDRTVGHDEDKIKLGLNPDMILGLTDFAVSASAINRANKKQKEAVKKGMLGSQQQLPTEFYSRFGDNGLYRSAGDRIDRMRQYKSVTSDPNQVLAERLTRDAAVDQIEAARDTKMSQLVDQYNDKLTAQKQQYSNMRTQITNENKRRWYEGLAQLDMLDANKIQQNAQNFKNLIYQGRQNVAKELDRRNQYMDKVAETKMRTEVHNALRAGFAQHGGFNAMSDDDNKQFGNDWISYMKYKYPEEYANIVNKAHIDNYTDLFNDPSRRLTWGNWWGDINVDIPWYEDFARPTNSGQQPTSTIKKGGTINRHRDVGEQQYLDQQKAINKAVNDLNNNIVKLFMKMMS